STGIIPDLLAARVGVRYAERTGYRHNRVNGDDVDDLDALSGRVAFLITPNENLDITVRGAYAKDDRSFPYELITSFPVPPFTEATHQPIAGADPTGLTNLTGGPLGPLPLGLFSAPAAALAGVGVLSPADIAALNGGSIAQFYNLFSQPGPIPP